MVGDLTPDAVDGSLLSLVSRMCNGDARVALQTVKISAKEAESEDMDKVAIGEIRSALKCSRKYRLSHLLGKLNANQRVIYNILRQNSRMESGSLFEEFCKKSSAVVDDRTYRNHMKRMEELGLDKSAGTGRWNIYETSVG